MVFENPKIKKEIEGFQAFYTPKSFCVEKIYTNMCLPHTHFVVPELSLISIAYEQLHFR
jgi:hypothetical protein